MSLEENHHTQKWKTTYLNTIPKYLLLMCSSDIDSICREKRNENKWIIERLHPKTKLGFFLSTFFVPLVWLLLSTLYKGDNITRLTAEPPLTQFDTFSSLVQNHFQIRIRTFNLNESHFHPYFDWLESAKLALLHGSVKGHEAFPIISELWYEIIMQLRPGQQNERSLIYLRDEISQKMWNFIDNSAMIVNYGVAQYVNMETIIDTHMNKCNRSAMILPRDMAFQLYTTLKRDKKPVSLAGMLSLKHFGDISMKVIFRQTYFIKGDIFLKLEL